MPKVLHFRRDLKHITISKEDYDYLMSRKLHGQPICEIHTKIFHEYRQKDISECNKAKDNLIKINDIYLRRIHQLETENRELKNGKQTILL